MSAAAGHRGGSRGTRGLRSGLRRSSIAVHSTALGPALGGARLWRYRLAGRRRSPTPCGSRQAMTYKAAAAGLDLGGGKGVICAPATLPRGDAPRA